MSNCPGVGWTGYHTLCTYHTAQLTNTPQPATGVGDCVLSEYHLNTISWNTHTRKLVNQSHGHFMSLQEEVRKEREAGGNVSAEVLVHYSRLYRSTLHECVLGLGTDTGLLGGGDGGVAQEDLVSYYAMLELAWHLCEILFIEVLPLGCLIQQLLEWVQRNGRPEEARLSELLAMPIPEMHKDYWKTLYHLIMRGQLNDACTLLQAHSQASTHPAVLQSMTEVLSSAPMCMSCAGLSRGELHRRWLDWRREVVHRSQTGDYGTSVQLQLLAKVLCGEEEAFKDEVIVESCDTWYELMVGKLLYTNPLVAPSDYDLPYCADWSIGVWREVHGRWEAGTLDRLLEAAMRNDFMEVTTISSSDSSDWWFVAHLSNLLMLKGLLTEQVLRSAPKLCEFWISEYSMGLLSMPSMWQVAMDYLSQCRSHGLHYMQLLVARVPLTTDKKANKVIHLCQRYNLKDQVKSVCKVMAMRAYKHGRLGAALTWCIRGKDSLFASFLVEKYMETFDSLGEFMDLDLLDHLGEAMLLSDRLMFLAKYREYHLLFERGELVKSGDLLISLLLSDSVPRRFLSTLLKDALGLLHENQLVFSSEQTYTLSHMVVGLNMSSRAGVGVACFEEDSPEATEKAELRKKVQDEVLRLLQVALVKNLSRALMEEST